MPHLFLARQPIYDRKLDVYAYELLYRAADEANAPAGIGDQATYTVLMNALTEIGLDDLVGPHYAFINLTRGFVVGDNPLPFSGNKIVVEVLEDIAADAEVIAGVKRLLAQGYMVALDDFIYDESLRELVELADLIKIDIMALDRTQLHEHVELLKKFDVKLLAEKVETQEEYELCKELGFDYFQGYFFCKPKILTRKRVPANQLAVMQLLSKLQDTEVDIEALGEVIGHDVSMSYRLLRYVNSAAFSLPKKVESLRHAVVFMGLKAVKEMVMVLVMSGANDKPHELLVTSLVRAKMCELMADSCSPANKEGCFVVGLFSVLDALLDMDMTELLKSLSLSDEISQALLQREGVAGEVLAAVIAYEQGQWDLPVMEKFEKEHLNQSYFAALSWAGDIDASISQA